MDSDCNTKLKLWRAFYLISLFMINGESILEKLVCLRISMMLTWSLNWLEKEVLQKYISPPEKTTIHNMLLKHLANPLCNNNIKELKASWMKWKWWGN